MFSLIEDKKRQRRRRTAFTDEQLDRLEEAFENEKFPGIQIREELSRELNIKEDRIQVTWLRVFVNHLRECFGRSDTIGNTI